MRNVAEVCLVLGALLLAGSVILPATVDVPIPLWSLLYGLAHLALGVGLVIECVVLLRWGVAWMIRKAR